MKRQPHPFARFINILGRGKTLTRSLTIEEAEEAMAMILAGETLPEQLGAFLMLLRVKEESPAEIAGFVRAARATIQAPAHAPHVDVDWSSYAGKGRQLPWFILSALILARNGWRVFMHGAEAHTQGRIYTGAALRALGVPASASLDEAADALAARNFAYLPIDALSPKIADMLELRPILGPAFARAHLRPHAQSVRRALYAAGRLPSGLHGYPSRRRRAPGSAPSRRLPRRGRRDRASAQQAVRGDDRGRGPAR